MEQHSERKRPTPTELNDLNSALLSEIFARVPMKYLLRLTSVCKPYYNLVKDHQFRKFHLENNTMKKAPDDLIVRNRMGGQQRGFSFYSATTFAYDENSELPRSLDIPWQLIDELDVYGFCVHGSCNGLLCLSSFHPRMDTPVYLYNPSLRKFKQLPQTKCTAIAADQRVTLGIGYYSGEDDYQVVRFIHPTTIIFYAEYYSLKSNSWKQVEYAVVPSAAGAWFLDGCTCLNGVIYGVLLHDVNVYLVSFNMRISVVGSRELPFQVEQLMYPYCLQVLHPECLRVLHENSLDDLNVDGLQGSEESLCLFQDLDMYQQDPHDCDIWVLKEATQVKVSRIRLPARASVAWPLGFSRNGISAYMVMAEDEDAEDLPRLARHVILHNYIQNYINEISLRPWYVDAYKESLVLLDEI